MPIAINDADKVWDMRPGKEVAASDVCGVNNKWSIPKFTPTKYSKRVAEPIIVTMIARKRANWRNGDRVLPGNKIHKDVPEKTSSNAVLGLKETFPGKMGFNSSKSNAQPQRTSPAIAAMVIGITLQ